uniref:Uncharacterized protein n=1 Tax=Anopheles arabiensis TaxID=7173 RepID=A0A182IF79_ANOAR
FPSARSCFAAAAVAVAVAVAAVLWHRFLLFGCVHPAAQNTHTHIRGRSVPCVLYLPFCASWRNQTTTKGSPFLPRSAPTF